MSSILPFPKDSSQLKHSACSLLSGTLRSNPVMVDGDRLTLRVQIHHYSDQDTAEVRVRMLVSEEGTPDRESIVLEGSAAAHDEVAAAEVVWDGDSDAVLPALQGSRVRLEMVVGSGVTVFAFGFTH